METKKKFLINAAFYAVVALLVVIGWKYVLPIMMPFVVGFFIASVVRFIMHKLKVNTGRYNKPLSVVLCAALYVLVVGLLGRLSYRLVRQITDFAMELPDLVDQYAYPFFVQVAQYITDLLEPIDPTLLEGIIDLGKDLAVSIGKAATSASTSLLKWVANSAISIPDLLVTVIITVVASFYIAADYHSVLKLLAKLIPESKRELVFGTLRYAKSAVIVYIKSYSIMFCLCFAEISLGLALMQVRYPALIALGIALFDLMPVLGAGGILLPWMVVLLVMGNVPMALGMLVLYLVIVAVRHAVEPRLVGNQIGLHPLATLVAMIFGLRSMGLMGMMLCPISLVAFMNLRKTMKKEFSPEQAGESQETNA